MILDGIKYKLVDLVYAEDDINKVNNCRGCAFENLPLCVLDNDSNNDCMEDFNKDKVWAIDNDE